MQFIKNIPLIYLYILVVLFALLLSVTSLLVHPILPLAIGFSCLLFFFSIRSPFALVVFFVLFLMARVADLIPIFGAIAAGKLISFAALFVLIFSKLLNRDLSIVRSPFNKWFIFFCISIFISCIFSTLPSISFDSFVNDFSKTIILFFLILNTVSSTKQIVIFQFCLAFICSFIGAYCIFSSFLGHDLYSGGPLIEGTRAGFVGTDPNDTALVIIIATPFLIYSAIERTGPKRVFFVLFTFLCVFGIFATQSRGGILGLSASVGLILNRYFKNKIVLVGVLISFLLIFFLAAGIADRSSGGSHENGLDASAQGRLDAWYAGGRMLIYNPITGVGFRMFMENVMSYMVNPVIRRRMVTHNSYIQIASELGFVGLIPFSIFIYYFIRSSFYISRIQRLPTTDSLYITNLSAFPSCVGLLVSALFLSVAYHIVLYVQFAYIAAYLHVFRPNISNFNELFKGDTIKC